MRALTLLLLVALTAAAQPARIVSTGPSFTEILFALGLGNRVVGVSEHCHFPAQADQLPKTGSYIKPNIEAIARLRPDLVILRDENTNAAERLRALKVQVLAVKIDTLPQIFAAIEQIGAAAQSPDRAAALRDKIQNELRSIRERTATLPQRSMVFVVGRNPGRLENLIVAGEGSYLSEVMSIAGGRNIFSNTVTPWPRVSLESIIRADPDTVVDMGEMAITAAVTPEQKQRVEALWQQVPLRAAKQQQVYAVADDIFVVPGPRVVQAARVFARMLHGENIF
jgi:iron complex transport system substrate-binding protein